MRTGIHLWCLLPNLPLVTSVSDRGPENVIEVPTRSRAPFRILHPSSSLSFNWFEWTDREQSRDPFRQNNLKYECVDAGGGVCTHRTSTQSNRRTVGTSILELGLRPRVSSKKVLGRSDRKACRCKERTVLEGPPTFEGPK